MSDTSSVSRSHVLVTLLLAAAVSTVLQDEQDKRIYHGKSAPLCMQLCRGVSQGVN
jgi:hypothetical protein